MKNQLNCFDLLQEKIIIIIKNAHLNYIINFRYCLVSSTNKEIIMSVSYKNRNLKLWNLSNWDCFLNLVDIYPKGYLYSSCFIIKNNNYYLATSNRITGSHSAEVIKFMIFMEIKYLIY